MIWAGEQEGQKLKKIDTGDDNFTYMGTRPTEPIITKFGVRDLVGHVITGYKLCGDRLRGFRSVGVRIWGSPSDLSCRLTTGQQYRAACDIEKIVASTVGFSGSGISNTLLEFSGEVAMVTKFWI